ncbi:MAG: hypothetical protein ACPGVO_22895 [Spirulinaceae cyanobacterium]
MSGTTLALSSPAMGNALLLVIATLCWRDQKAIGRAVFATQFLETHSILAIQISSQIKFKQS